MRKLIAGLGIVVLASTQAAGFETETPRAAISIIGFYNSETPEFNPGRIGYGAMVNFAEAHAALSKVLEEGGYQVIGYGEFEEGFEGLNEEEGKLLGPTVRGLLSRTNDFLRGEENSPGCDDLRLPDFSKNEGYPGWDETSRLYLFIGLETLSPSGRGLRSGLTAGLFDGNGACRRVSTVLYDFTNYDTADFISDGKQLITAVQMKQIEN